MEKVTMQDIADVLNVSRVTVWKVLNNQQGVSKTLRDQILLTAKEIGYTKPGSDSIPYDKEYTDSESSQITISLIISRPESSVFWANIIHAVAKQLDKGDISLMYTYLPPNYYKGYTLPNSLTKGSIDGMLIMNVYDYELLSMLNNLDVPKVFLDLVTKFPVDTLTGDVFFLEGKHSVSKITDHLIKKGCSQIGFVGDTIYAQTNKERFEGFKHAMEKNNLPINQDLCLTGSIGIYTYYDEISSFLNSLDKMPEAFVCASDYVANFLIQYFYEHGYNIPEDVAITGYDGSTEYAMVSGTLTTVQVQTGDLGKRLAKQLLYRINNPDSSLEIIYIRSKILWGKSTNF